MKKYLHLILIIVFLFLKTVTSQSDNLIIIDKNFSSYVGSENTISLNKFLYEIEERTLKPKLSSESTPPKKVFGICYRSLKTLLLDYPTIQLLWIIQHEYFGHGYKGRELNFKNINYIIAFPFPYGEGNGHTRFDQNINMVTSHEMSAIYYSGSQATSIVTNSLRLRFVKNKSINYRESMHYLISFSDLTKYVLSTNYKTAKNSNDIVNYIDVTYHGRSREAELKKLKRKVIVNFLNPFPYLSLYTFFKTYFWKGNSENSLPMVPFWGVDYLPSFRFGLSPYGYEICSEHYLRTSNNVINFYCRYGEPGLHKNWGSGLYVSNLFSASFISFDGYFHIWKQPELLTSHSQYSSKTENYGYAVLLTGFFPPMKRKHFNFLVQIGVKSRGFLEGENLSRDTIVRVGLSL